MHFTNIFPIGSYSKTVESVQNVSHTHGYAGLKSLSDTSELVAIQCIGLVSFIEDF